MKAVFLLSLILLSSFSFSQNQADQYYDPAEMQSARDKMTEMGGDQTNYLILAERLEYTSYDNDEGLVWGAQGWIGSDSKKLWLKTEGDYDLDNNSTEEFEIQVLYSQALAPFWDVQLGLRHDFEPKKTRNYAVLGIQGLTPYWFEIDLAAFVSDEGKVSSRFEVEYELRLSQRLLLQPRLELSYAFSEDVGIGSGRGMNNTELGLRLRYEIKKEIAPYLGVSWQKAYGATANLLNLAGQDNEGFAVVAGIRFWY